MNQNPDLIAAARLSRRELLGALAALGPALAMRPLDSLLPEPARAESGTRCPIVSFHMDQPYLDWSGRALPYHPPSGARSAEPVAHLSEEMFRRHWLCA